MNKWLEYHEAMERRIMEMMRPEAPDPAYERGWQDYTQGKYREAAGQFADSARMYEKAGASDSLNHARTLYALGEAISGAEQIEALAGEIRIEKVENAPPEETTQQSAAPVPTGREPADGTEQEENAEMKINVQAGGRTFTATLEKNAATEAFAELMKNAPLVLSLSDYAGFEKVGALGTSLPAEDRQITAQAGDIVLYNGNQIVLFYGANSWSYTKLGRIDDLSGWEEALGGGDITVSFSIE